MIYAFAISLFSILGIISIFLRHIPQVRRMSDEELVGVLQKEPPLLTQAWEYALHLVQSVWYRHLREKTYTFAVKRVSEIRILILRMEQTLFRFTARLRERTRAPKAPSDYWKDMHEWRKTVHWHKKEE